MSASNPRPILLVGSVNLGSADEVFRTAGHHLGGLAPAIPDGETGDRLKWAGFFSEKLRDVPEMEVVHELPIGGRVPQTLRFYKPREGKSLADVRLGSPGYAEIARASYADFVAARERGEVPDGTRFQVSLPTPIVLSAFLLVPFEERLAFVEQIMLEEVAQIVAAIPHHDLSLQWDMALETEAEEARLYPDRAPAHIHPGWPFEAMIAATARWGAAVPEDVRLGYHLCYGMPDGGHLIEPEDGSVMVKIASALAAAARRRIDYIHMPVPIARDDDAFFEPFERLALPSETEIFLGVVHEQDGVDGARRRMDAAARHLDRPFGVATECGMGQRAPDQVAVVMDLHREIAHA